jgi:hypothetical protein
LPPVARPIRSLIAAAARELAEVTAFPCIDVVETAADKLSALAWRVRVRRRGEPKDDQRSSGTCTTWQLSNPRWSLRLNFASSYSPRSRRMSGGEGRRTHRPIRPLSLPKCCSGSKPTRYGRGNTRILCGECLSQMLKARLSLPSLSMRARG